MFEWIMLFSIGFLCACFLTLGVVVHVHNRAVRITTQKMVETEPMSMAELQAHKDQARVQFAVAVHRLESTIKTLQERVGSQLADLGRNCVEIRHLRVELDKRSTAILALQVREQLRKSIIRRILKLQYFLFMRRSTATRRTGLHTGYIGGRSAPIHP